MQDLQLITEGTDADLAKIRELTQREVVPEDVYIFSATFATDAPTYNGRVYVREWLEKMTPDFEGAPLTINHSSRLEDNFGAVLSAQYAEGRITGRAYIDRKHPGAGQLIEWLERKGATQGVSIESSGNRIVPDGQTIRVFPGPRSRVAALSLVGAPACRDCRILAEGAAPGEEAPDAPEGPETAPDAKTHADPLAEYARFGREAAKGLADETVRYCGFVVGPKGRETYRKLADALDPFTLREWCGLLKAAYAESHKADAAKLQTISEAVQAEKPADTSAEKALKRIRQKKGVTTNGNN